jgi:hypothetical protein
MAAEFAAQNHPVSGLFHEQGVLGADPRAGRAAQAAGLVQVDAVLQAQGIFRAGQSALATAGAALLRKADAGGGNEREVRDVRLGAAVGAGGYRDTELVVMAEGMNPAGQEFGPPGMREHGFEFRADILPEHGMRALDRASANLEAMGWKSFLFGLLHESSVLQKRIGNP